MSPFDFFSLYFIIASEQILGILGQYLSSLFFPRAFVFIGIRPKIHRSGSGNGKNREERNKVLRDSLRKGTLKMEESAFAAYSSKKVGKLRKTGFFLPIVAKIEEIRFYTYQLTFVK